MAFKLTKDQTAAKAELAAAIEKAWAAVEDAVGVFNDSVSQAKEVLTAQVAAFNDVAGQVATFTAEIAGRADEDISGRSEKWQEGDAGQAAIEWKDEWENFDADGIENIDWPDDLAIEQPTVVDMDALPEEA
jgi:hypothetical protein